MQDINLAPTVVIPSNSPAWTDMVAKNPQQALNQMNSGLPKPTVITPDNMVHSTDPALNMSHVNPVR